MKMFDVMRSFEESLREIELYKPPISESKTRDITGFALNYKDFAPYIARKIEEFISNTAFKHKLSGLYIIDSICKAKGGVNEIYKQHFGINLANIVNSVLVPELTERQRESVKKVVRIWNERKLFSKEVMAKLAPVLRDKLNYTIAGFEDASAATKNFDQNVAHGKRASFSSSKVNVNSAEEAPSVSTYFPQTDAAMRSKTTGVRAPYLPPAVDSKHTYFPGDKTQQYDANLEIPSISAESRELYHSTMMNDQVNNALQPIKQDLQIQPSTMHFTGNSGSSRMGHDHVKDPVAFLRSSTTLGAQTSNEEPFKKNIDSEAIKNLATALPLSSFNIPLVQPLPFRLLDLVSSQEQQEEEQVDPKKVIESRNRREMDARMMRQKQAKEERLDGNVRDANKHRMPHYSYQFSPHKQPDGVEELRGNLRSFSKQIADSNAKEAMAIHQDVRLTDQGSKEHRIHGDGQFKNDFFEQSYRSNNTGAQSKFNEKSPSSTLFIGNLAPTVTEFILHSIFDPYGTVENVFLKLDKQFAFVTFQTHQEAQLAKQCENDRLVEGRSIRIGWGRNINKPQVPTTFGGDNEQDGTAEERTNYRRMQQDASEDTADGKINRKRRFDRDQQHHAPSSHQGARKKYNNSSAAAPSAAAQQYVENENNGGRNSNEYDNYFFRNDAYARPSAVAAGRGEFDSVMYQNFHEPRDLHYQQRNNNTHHQHRQQPGVLSYNNKMEFES